MGFIQSGLISLIFCSKERDSDQFHVISPKVAISVYCFNHHAFQVAFHRFVIVYVCQGLRLERLRQYRPRASLLWAI